MKQLVITRYGPPEVLAVREAPDPIVTVDTVRIRVAAAGINFSDIMARQGLYPDAPKPPCVIGYEVAGVVDAVASGVGTPRVGDRVIATTKFGGQSELVVVPAANVFPLPDGWSFEEGAAFPVVYLTAHHMLVRVAAAQPGDTVLVHAAAGGVGLAVAELGRILGCGCSASRPPGNTTCCGPTGWSRSTAAIRTGPRSFAVSPQGVSTSYSMRSAATRGAEAMTCSRRLGDSSASGHPSFLWACAAMSSRLEGAAVAPVHAAHADESQPHGRGGQPGAAMERGPNPPAADRGADRLRAGGPDSPARGSCVSPCRGSGGPPLHSRAPQRREGGPHAGVGIIRPGRGVMPSTLTTVEL